MLAQKTLLERYRMGLVGGVELERRRSKRSEYFAYLISHHVLHVSLDAGLWDGYETLQPPPGPKMLVVKERLADRFKLPSELLADVMEPVIVLALRERAFDYLHKLFQVSRKVVEVFWHRFWVGAWTIVDSDTAQADSVVPYHGGRRQPTRLTVVEMMGEVRHVVRLLMLVEEFLARRVECVCNICDAIGSGFDPPSDPWNITDQPPPWPLTVNKLEGLVYWPVTADRPEKIGRTEVLDLEPGFLSLPHGRVPSPDGSNAVWTVSWQGDETGCCCIVPVAVAESGIYRSYDVPFVPLIFARVGEDRRPLVGWKWRQHRVEWRALATLLRKVYVDVKVLVAESIVEEGERSVLLTEP